MAEVLEPHGHPCHAELGTRAVTVCQVWSQTPIQTPACCTRLIRQFSPPHSPSLCTLATHLPLKLSRRVKSKIKFALISCAQGPIVFCCLSLASFLQLVLATLQKFFSASQSHKFPNENCHIRLPCHVQNFYWSCLPPCFKSISTNTSHTCLILSSPVSSHTLHFSFPMLPDRILFEVG